MLTKTLITVGSLSYKPYDLPRESTEHLLPGGMSVEVSTNSLGWRIVTLANEFDIVIGQSCHHPEFSSPPFYSEACWLRVKNVEVAFAASEDPQLEACQYAIFLVEEVDESD